MSASFCQAHLSYIKNDENYAFNAWNNVMNKAVRAYIECKKELAITLFKTASDIAFLRLSIKNNFFFDNTTITKPSEFIISLLCDDCEFKHATDILLKLSDLETLQQHNRQANDIGSLDQLTTFIYNQHISIKNKSLSKNLSQNYTPLVMH